MGHARALITIDDHEAQIDLLKQTIEEELSVREVERRVREYQQAEEEAEAEDADTDAEAEVDPAPTRDELQLEEYRNQLRSRFSTQVNIRHKSDGEGKIEISYYSAEDLERLMDMLEE